MWSPSCVKVRLRFAFLFSASFLFAGCAIDLGGKPDQPQASQQLQGDLQSKHAQALQAMNQQEFERARVLFEEMVRVQPGVVTPYVNLGIIAEKRGDAEQAKHWYEKALAIDPAQPEALNQMGVLNREAGQFERALEYYQRALRADDSLPQVHYNLAILYDLYLGDYRNAIKHYERYQNLSQADSERVAQWITDLKRRVQ